MKTFTDIIALWPHKTEFAADLGVPYERAKAWSTRNSIPGQYFSAVAAAAQGRGLDSVTVDVLSTIAASSQRPRMKTAA